jgi:hypothetical protein
MALLRRAALVALAILAGCVPTLEGRGSLVDEPRVLAVQAEPAEAAPGQAMGFRALYVDPLVEAPATAIEWAYCTDRAPLDRLEPVSPRCLTDQAEWLVPIGNGANAAGPLPGDGCRQFGPNPPAAPAGEPALRPVDPDRTGGFYQPVRLLVGGAAFVTYQSRIRCAVAGTTLEQANELTRRSSINANPVILALEEVTPEGLKPIAPDAPHAVVSGAAARLRVSWPSCPDAAVCGGAERYVLFDPVERVVAERREAMRVSWFATAGTFENERTAVEPGEETPSASENVWQAGTMPGEVRLWVVLRDDRGGTSWQRYRLNVAP